MGPITKIIVNTYDGKENIFTSKYRIQINRMGSHGEYIYSMTFKELTLSNWIPDDEKENVIEFIYKNNGEHYDSTFDGICFNKKEDAEIVVNYLNTLYQTYLLRGKK